MLALVVTFNLDGLTAADFRGACDVQWCSAVAARDELPPQCALGGIAGRVFTFEVNSTVCRY
jgi:hypothetical protein